MRTSIRCPLPTAAMAILTLLIFGVALGLWLVPAIRAAIVQAPAGFVPSTSIGFGGIGETYTPISTATPLPTADPANAAFRVATPMTPGATVAAGRSVALICTAAGNVALVLAGGSTLTVPASTGLTILPFAATSIASSVTTATCTYASLS